MDIRTLLAVAVFLTLFLGFVATLASPKTGSAPESVEPLETAMLTD